MLGDLDYTQPTATASLLYDAVDRVVNTQTGMLPGVARPIPVFDYLLSPGDKIPPHGVDAVLYAYKDKPHELPVKIMAGKHDVSGPFMKKMTALEGMSVDFAMYEEHIQKMNKTELDRFMVAVKRLPQNPTPDQYNKMNHTLAEHLKKENRAAFRNGQGNPRSMLKASSTQGFITMIEAASSRT